MRKFANKCVTTVTYSVTPFSQTWQPSRIHHARHTICRWPLRLADRCRRPLHTRYAWRPSPPCDDRYETREHAYKYRRTSSLLPHQSSYSHHSSLHYSILYLLSSEKRVTHDIHLSHQHLYFHKPHQWPVKREHLPTSPPSYSEMEKPTSAKETTTSNSINVQSKQRGMLITNVWRSWDFWAAWVGCWQTPIWHSFAPHCNQLTKRWPWNSWVPSPTLPPWRNSVSHRSRHI